MNIKTLPIFLLILLPIGISAQEWNISLGAGSSSLKYETGLGEAKAGFGGAFGFGYTQFFGRFVGLGFGLEGALYQASLEVADYSLQTPVATPAGLSGNFFMQADYDALAKTQMAPALQVPVMLQAQIPMGSSQFFYLAAGAKIGLPLATTWKQTAGSLTTRGYSEYTGQTYENMPSHGFTVQSPFAASGSLELNSASGGSAIFLTFIAEAGFKFKISDKNSVYTGVFMDLAGLNSVFVMADKKLLEYGDDSSFNYLYNSILQTNDINVSQDGIKPFAFGLKIRMAFGSGRVVPPPQIGETAQTKGPGKSGRSAASTTTSSRGKTAGAIAPAKVGDRK